MPQFAALRHAQQTKRRKDVAEDDISAGAEPGDGKARQRSQHTADKKKQGIGAGKRRTAPMKSFPDRRQEHSIGKSYIAAHTAVSQHQAEKSRPALETNLF